MDRRATPSRIAWPALATGMVAGWVFAPLHVVGVVVAQLLSGMCLSAFEGDMDGRLAHRHAADSAATAALAWGASARALGGSLAVGLLPLILAGVALSTFSAVLATALVVIMLLAAVSPGRSRTSLPARS